MEREILFQLDIRAPVECVWRALTDPEQIPRWSYMDAIEVAGEGERVVQSWRIENADADTAEILTSEENRRLVYRWTSSEPAPTVVEYEIEAVGGLTRLRFRNHGYLEGPAWDKLHDANYRGWLAFHLSLKNLLESEAP